MKICRLCYSVNAIICDMHFEWRYFGYATQWMLSCMTPNFTLEWTECYRINSWIFFRHIYANNPCYVINPPTHLQCLSLWAHSHSHFCWCWQRIRCHIDGREGIATKDLLSPKPRVRITSTHFGRFGTLNTSFWTPWVNNNIKNMSDYITTRLGTVVKLTEQGEHYTVHVHMKTIALIKKQRSVVALLPIFLSFPLPMMTNDACQL